MSKIRVALMTSTIDGRRASGTALVARKCVEALLKRRDQFELTFIHYEPDHDEIYQHGVREIVLPKFQLQVLNRRSIRQIYYFLTTADRFDILHWFQPRLYPFFWRAPARHLVVSVHGTGDIMDNNVHFIFSRAVYNLVLRLFKHHVSAAIGVSAFARQDIIEKYGFTPAQVIAINNAVDSSFTRASPEEIARVVKKYALPEGKFFLGVGRLVPNKNVPRILRAYQRYVQQVGARALPFVHIGSSGIDRPLVDEILRNSSCGKRITLLGYVDQGDLSAVYSAAHGLVFPLLNEGFGLPAIEAMACGTPTIISETAQPEISSEDSLLVDALDEEGIAHAMARLGHDEALHTKLADRGRLLARRFTWEETGRHVIELYQRLALGSIK